MDQQQEKAKPVEEGEKSPVCSTDCTDAPSHDEVVKVKPVIKYFGSSNVDSTIDQHFSRALLQRSKTRSPVLSKVFPGNEDKTRKERSGFPVAYSSSVLVQPLPPMINKFPSSFEKPYGQSAICVESPGVRTPIVYTPPHSFNPIHRPPVPTVSPGLPNTYHNMSAPYVPVPPSQEGLPGSYPLYPSYSDFAEPFPPPCHQPIQYEYYSPPYLLTTPPVMSYPPNMLNYQLPPAVDPTPSYTPYSAWNGGRCEPPPWEHQHSSMQGHQVGHLEQNLSKVLMEPDVDPFSDLPKVWGESKKVIRKRLCAQPPPNVDEGKESGESETTAPCSTNQSQSVSSSMQNPCGGIKQDESVSAGSVIRSSSMQLSCPIHKLGVLNKTAVGAQKSEDSSLEDINSTITLTEEEMKSYSQVE